MLGGRGKHVVAVSLQRCGLHVLDRVDVLTHLWEDGNCTWACICKRRRHAHTTIRFLIGISRIAYRLHGHGTWACTRPSLAHNTARLVCCVYKEGEYNTCVGAACTSSIELTCSCACGRMALHVDYSWQSAVACQMFIMHIHTHACSSIVTSRITSS